MPTWLANAIEKLLDFSNTLNVSIAASWMVLAVIVLRYLLKKVPRWTSVALWGLVAIRLLLPFSIESAFSLIPSAETVPQQMLVYEGTQLQDSAFLNVISNPVFSGSVTVELSETVDRVQVNLIKITPIWLLGAVALMVYTVVSYLHLRFQVSEATLLRDNIYQSESVASPFVLGLYKPRIYLPYGMSAETMYHVVAHEQAHIRRKDHWWKPLGFFLLTVHWFNPLMWVAYSLLCRDIELACDEKVIKKLGNEQRADYTQALVACSINRRRIAACPLAFGEVGVKERVKSVMHYKKPAFWVIVLSIVTCAVVAICFLTDPITSVRNPWVQEYVPGVEGIIGRVDKEKYESISEDFAIGADQYGRAVFKTPHKAFDTFIVLFADGIALIQEQNDLAPISKKNYSAYKTLGWQVTSGSEEAQQQAIFVTKFLDIYENSFTKDIPSASTEIPTTESTPPVTNQSDAQPSIADIVDPTEEENFVRDEKDLSTAVISAILDHNRPSDPDGLYHCASFVLLTQEELCFDSDPPLPNQVTVYGIALHEKFSLAEELIREVESRYIPVKLTFEKTPQGAFRLLNSWFPNERYESWDQYSVAIYEQFSTHSDDLATSALYAILDEIYLVRLKQECYRQAVAYIGMDTEPIMERLFAVIESSPLFSSNPGSYIDAHPAEYKELIYYGDCTLQYIFSKFLAGNQIGLRGHIMRSLLDDLAPEAQLRLYAMTGQEYFDEWKSAAIRVSEQHEMEWIKENQPAIWFLLQMIVDAGA